MTEEKKEASHVVPFRPREAERPAAGEPIISVREIGSGTGSGKTDLVIVTSGFPLPAVGGKTVTCLAQAA